MIALSSALKSFGPPRFAVYVTTPWGDRCPVGRFVRRDEADADAAAHCNRLRGLSRHAEYRVIVGAIEATGPRTLQVRVP